MSSVATPPVDPREDRLYRAIKARADGLMKPLYGPDGSIASPGLDEMEASKRAVSHLRPFLMANPQERQPWKDYLDGKVDQPPKGWVPDYTTPEDIRQFRAEGMARARSENPWLAAGTDALNTVGSLGEGFVQGVTDMATGAANLIPGVTVPRVDVKASLRAFALNHVPWLKEQGKTFTTDEARRELDATKDSANALTQVAEMTGQGVGSMYSMIGTGGTGAIGKISQVTSAPFRGAMKLGDGIGKVLGKGTGMAITEKSGRLAKLISEGTGKIALSQAAGTVIGSAVGIAADKAIKAGTTQDAATGQERKTTMGERAGQAGVGAAEGALFGLLGEVGKAAFRSMFKSPLSKLGVDEKNAVTTLSEWAKQNRLFQVGRETTEAYSKRLLNAYAEAGFPGAPRMYGRQILGRAMQGGIEGLGFSALDERFHRDLFDGAFQGDTQALKRALIAYGAGVFQTMAMHIPLKDIPRAQRRQDFTPTGEAPKPQEPVKPVEPKVDALGESVDVFAADKKKTADLDWMEKAGKTPVGYDKPQGPPSNAAPVPDKAVGAALSPNLSRLGWETKDAGYITGFDSGQKIDPATLEPSAVAPKPPAPIDPTTGAVLGESSGQVPTSDPNWQSGQAGTAPLGGAGDAAPKRPQVDPTTGAILGESSGDVPASAPNWRSDQASRAAVGGDAQGDTRGSIDPSTGVRMSPTQTHYLPGTKFGFEVDGDVARPTKALRDALGVPTELPVTELVQAIEGASVMDALVALETMPGDQISASPPIMATAEGDGVMRTIQFGVPMESPLSPSVRWVDVDSYPARGKDPIPQEQAQVVEILTDIINTRQDLPEHSRAMLSKAADVMDTVSLHNNEAVAETMGVVADLVPVIAQGTPEQAAKAVQALGESLTVKHPEIALRDMAGPQEPVQKAPPRGDDNPDGYGPAQVGMGVPIPPEVIAGLKTTGRGAGGIVKRGFDWFQKSLVKRAEDAGLTKLVPLIRKSVSKTRDFVARHGDAGLYDLKRTDRKAQKSLGEELLSDQHGGHTTLYQAKQDKDSAGYFGPGRSLTPEEQRIVDLGRGTISEGAKIAEELGVKFRNLDSGEERGITYDPKRQILPRVPTALMTQTTMNRRGPVWDALVKWFGDARGKTVEEVTQEYVNKSSAVSFDPTEHVRFERVIPSRLTVEGKIVKLFEDTPVEHAERLAYRNAHIMGALSAIPRKAAEKVEGAAEYKSELNEAIPENAQQLLNEIQTEYGKDIAREAEAIIRSMHGMAIRNDPSWAGAPGTDVHTAVNVIGDAFGVLKALALSLSAVKNIPEPLANVPFLTLKGITNGYGTLLRSMKDKSVGDLHRQLVSEGYLVDSKENVPHSGDALLEKWDANLQEAKNILMTPMRIFQDGNELVLASAAKERLEAMQRGEGVDNDLAALKLLGFRADEAMAMIQGKGSAEMYAEYKNRIVANLTGGKGLHGVEKSMAAHSRGFNALVWFSGFFQARTRAADATWQRFKEAKDLPSRVAAGKQMLALAGFAAMSGMVGNLISKWVAGDDAVDYLRESVSGGTGLEMLGNGLSTFAQLAISGTLGGVGAPISDALFGADKEGRSAQQVWLERLGSLVAPLGATTKVVDLANALMGEDVPGYEGKTGWQSVAQYLKNVAPLARALDKGLFGLSAIAITDKDPELDAAQDSYYRWLFKNAPPGDGDNAEKSKAWRDSMRKVVERVAAGDAYGDDALMDAMVDAQDAIAEQADKDEKRVSVREAKQRIAASLEARQFLSKQKLSRLSLAQQESLFAHLGEENIQRLQDYDVILKTLAKKIAPPRRF